jgi:hypothetical protein
MAVYHDATVYAPCLYDTLAADLAGTQGENKTPAKSLPPLWIDALQLINDMDAMAAKWWPKPMPTVERIQALGFATWRPQDTDMVEAMARTINGWADQILHLLDPESVKHISAPCPNCTKTHIWKRDSAGDTVRQPALRLIVNQGCSCQACGAVWPPDKYLWLAKLLGYDLPEGVNHDEIQSR